MKLQALHQWWTTRGRPVTLHQMKMLQITNNNSCRVWSIRTNLRTADRKILRTTALHVRPVDCSLLVSLTCHGAPRAIISLWRYGRKPFANDNPPEGLFPQTRISRTVLVSERGHGRYRRRCCRTPSTCMVHYSCTYLRSAGTVQLKYLFVIIRYGR